MLMAGLSTCGGFALHVPARDRSANSTRSHLGAKNNSQDYFLNAPSPMASSPASGKKHRGEETTSMFFHADGRTSRLLRLCLAYYLLATVLRTVPARTLTLKTIHRIVFLTRQARWLQVRPLVKKHQGEETTLMFFMLMAGLEPARYCYRGILSPLRLPISPHQQMQQLS